MSSGVQVYIFGRRHTTLHSRVIRRVVNIRGALTHQVQHQNKLWAAHTPRSDHCGVQYTARKGRQLRESTAVDIDLPSPLDNLEIGNAFSGRFWRMPTRGDGRTPREWRRIYTCFEDLFLHLFTLVHILWSRKALLGWWRGCPGEARRMAAWFTFTVAFSTTLISQVWRMIIHPLGGLETSAENRWRGTCFMICFLGVFFKEFAVHNRTDVFLNHIPFSFRYLGPVFLSSIFMNLKITKVCWQTETHANPTVGLISEFAWRTTRLWSRQVTVSLEVQWQQCWGQTLSAPRRAARYLDRFRYRSTLDGR